MPRLPRIVLPGFPHHVTQRGNRRNRTFLDDADFRTYLGLMRKYSVRHNVAIYTYGLMPNHDHQIARPTSKEGLSNYMHDLAGGYAEYFNEKYDLTGHLWEARFYGCVVDDVHLWNAVRYVEQNAVRGKLVSRAEAWPWSSAAAHCGLCEDRVLTGDFPPPGLVLDWASWLSQPLEERELDRLRKATHKGSGYATEHFLKELENLTGLCLLPRKRGRPSLPQRLPSNP
jgi:putative transposase